MERIAGNVLTDEELEAILGEDELHGDDISGMVLSGELIVGDADIHIAEGEL